MFDSVLVTLVTVSCSNSVVCYFEMNIKGLFICGELGQLDRLAPLGEMIFILRSYGIFYFISFKTYVMSLEKDCFDDVIFKWF